MFKKHFNIILVGLIIFVSTGTLIWQRFNIEPQAAAFVGDTEFYRGEVVHADDITLLTYNGAQIWMDQNTDVKLIDGTAGSTIINVLQGRVVILDSSATIETRDLKIVVNGTTSFVNYSWENRVEIASITGSTRLERNGDIVDLTNQALSTTTFPPYEDEYKTFDPENSSAAEFYKTALTK